MIAPPDPYDRAIPTHGSYTHPAHNLYDLDAAGELAAMVDHGKPEPDMPTAPQQPVRHASDQTTMTDMQPRPEGPHGRRPADEATPRPPAVAPLPTPRAVDAARLVWWLQTGFRHGMTKGNPGGRLLSGALWLGWWPTCPLLVTVQALVLGNRRSRYYLSPDRDAVLAIRATGQGWVVQAHQSHRPGTGAGQALRAQLMPDLVDTADRESVTIYTTATNPHLAALYTAELPGLTDIGRAWPRGRRLRRTPGGPGIAAPPGTRPAE